MLAECEVYKNACIKYVESLYSYDRDYEKQVLTKGNSKLGNGIYSFSLPPALSCPTSTETCREHCYVRRYLSQYPNVEKKYNENFTLANSYDFVRTMILDIQNARAKVVRVHVSGDFFNKNYIDSWYVISAENPNVLFYAYTKAWREFSFIPSLEDLVEDRPNWRLWYSCDRETGEPPQHTGIKRCYMMVDDTDIPSYRTDLVFRVKRDTRVPFVNGTLVCPHENGNEKKGTCTTCKFCTR